MSKVSVRLSLLPLTAIALFSASAAKALPIPSAYGCSGTCGALGADGVVTAPPSGAATYLYVTTAGSLASAPIPTGAVGGETNGSVLSTPTFTVNPGSVLQYNFNFVTSDGSQFSDYAWAELFNSDGSTAALLFDARTEPSGSIVPGQGLPTPVATLTPSSVPIIPGAPSWTPLGASSNSCFAAGCGYTGWVGSSYTIASGGSYYLSFGVTNELDTQYDTGLAIDGITINGTPITPPTSTTPEPSSLMLLGTGIAGIATAARRRFSR